MRAKIRRSQAIIVAAFMALLSSCELPRTCVGTGCDDRLRVQLLGSLPDSLRVSAEEPGGARWVVDCTPARCYDGMVYFPFTPEAATIEVHGVGIDIVRTVRPVYYLNPPEGTGCGEHCREATVQIQLR